MYTCSLRPARKWEAPSGQQMSPGAAQCQTASGAALCAGIKARSANSGCVISYSCALLRDTPLRSKWPLLECQHPVLSYLETVFEALNKDLLFWFLNRWKEKTSLTLNSLSPTAAMKSTAFCTSQTGTPHCPQILLLLSGQLVLSFSPTMFSNSRHSS